MTAARVGRWLGLVLAFLAVLGAWAFRAWPLAIVGGALAVAVLVPMIGAPVAVRRSGGSVRAAVAVFAVLYAPRLVRRLARVDELDRTPGVPALAPITVRSAWADAQGGWWARIQIVRDSDVPRWQDLRGEVGRALGGRLPMRGEDLRIEAAEPGWMLWRYFSRDPLAGVREAAPGSSLVVRVGRRETGGDVHLDFSEASHVAIQGMTRSGKSVFCYNLAASLARCPDARVWGVDPNSVFLSPLAVGEDAERFVLGNKPEEAADLLRRFVEHMDDRIALLASMGVDKFESFSEALPVDVLFLEEWPGLVRAAAQVDRKVKAEIERLVARLVSEGAKAGVRVVLIAQRLSAHTFDTDSRGQFGTRITFAVDNGEAVRMLHPSVDSEVSEMVSGFPPGRALLWQHRAESVMQGDLLDYQQYRSRVRGAHRAPLSRDGVRRDAKAPAGQPSAVPSRSTLEPGHGDTQDRTGRAS